MAEVFHPRQDSTTPTSLLTILPGGWVLLWGIFGNLSEQDSQRSGDCVLGKPSKAGMGPSKGNLPNPAFLLFNIE